MKPYEEKWELSPGVEVDVMDVYAVGEATAIKDIPQRVAPIVSAAPDMARALLALLAEKQGVIMTRAEADLFTAAQMALTKAGVLP